jgi:hypothetical protein
MWRRLLALIAAITLSIAHPVSAQVFGSVGGALASNDQAERFPLAYRDPATSFQLLLEAGAFVGRFGAGVELLRVPDLHATTSGRFGTFAALETERAVTATVRIRAVRRTSASLELFGGAGVAFASAETTLTSRDTGGVFAQRDSQRARTFVGGCDVPFRVVPHLQVAATLRIYHFVRRAMPIIAYDTDVGPSNRVIVGGVARLVW